MLYNAKLMTFLSVMTKNPTVLKPVAVKEAVVPKPKQTKTTTYKSKGLA
jgi:hypothetical protein